ncbi:hypothetical protein EVAR_7943_1 [Eumeta japonica]|uniref:Uncharacterized protein n=1 Tax=Eumeta variegata TaxID=151549 RepID=A0A4C1THV6_EUMVA|nr:hypothetical protein EVAR_7943_1 [Eumeta japonica]
MPKGKYRTEMTHRPARVSFKELGLVQMDVVFTFEINVTQSHLPSARSTAAVDLYSSTMESAEMDFEEEEEVLLLLILWQRKRRRKNRSM